MAKGYWIAGVDVDDQHIYQGYIEGARPVLEKYGAKFLARGGKLTSLEGNSRARHVVIEFESVEKALECYNTQEYQAAKAIRDLAATCDIYIIEGVD